MNSLSLAPFSYACNSSTLPKLKPLYTLHHHPYKNVNQVIFHFFRNKFIVVDAWFDFWNPFGFFFIETENQKWKVQGGVNARCAVCCRYGFVCGQLVGVSSSWRSQWHWRWWVGDRFSWCKVCCHGDHKLHPLPQLDGDAFLLIPLLD